MAINNMDDLRRFLVNDMERCSEGDITPAVANATANLGGKILQTVKLELEYNSIAGLTPNIGFLGKLGNKVAKFENKSLAK
jgi:hypothetical protein